MTAKSNKTALRYALAGVFSLTILGASLTAAQAANGPVVSTQAGKVQGVSAEGVDAFKGVPFAAPPLGELRWRAPQPVKPWTETLDASQYGPDCMQTPFGGDAAPLGTTPSEDCLVLNVWRPAGAQADTKLPVIVWIYGGGFVNGGSSPEVYDGSSFARNGVIMVSFNYRIGRFGFFGHPELTRQNKDNGLLGNYGYMDQIAALKWVRDNIAAFGGDPSNVTIFGESAGGGSVQMLLTSPLSQGLFHKAIVQSGGGRANLMGARKLTEDQPELPSSETLGVNMARKHGITGDGPEALAAMRALPAEVVNDNMSMVTMGQQAETYGGPMMDGVIVVSTPQEAYEAARQSKVPLMIGATSADIGFGFAPTKEAAFAAFGPLAEQARKAYDPDGTLPLAEVNRLIGMDKMMVEPSRYVAGMFAKQGLPSYHFRFSYVANSMENEWKTGTPHATEIPYVMNTVKAKYGAALTARDAKIAEQTNLYWANFAKTGNPNGAGLPEWPRYDPAKDVMMDFAADGVPAAKVDPWAARLNVVAAAADLPPPPPLPTRTPSGHYGTRFTMIGEIMKDPAAKAVLAKHLPEVVNNEQIGQAYNMTVQALAGYLPTITDGVMDAIDADLAKLPVPK